MGRHRSPWTSWKAGYFQQLPQLRRRPLMVELPLMNLIEYAAVLQELPLRSPCMVSYFCSLFFWHSWCKSSKVGCQITWSRGLVMPGFCGKAQPIRLRELCGGVVKAISSIFLVPQKEPLAVRACLRLQVGSRRWEPQPWRIHPKIANECNLNQLETFPFRLLDCLAILCSWGTNHLSSKSANFSRYTVLRERHVFGTLVL